MSDVTQILNAIEGGDERAADDLLPLIYEELRLLAAQKLSHESPGQTLQATALVHEVYLRLVGIEDHRWKDSRHFFNAAAEAMRRILIDKAREKKSLKRGGGRQRVDLEGAITMSEDLAGATDLLALDEALQKLAREDPLKAELVTLRYFAGLTIPQTAHALAISHATAERHWDYARSWLRVQISGIDQTP